MTRSASIWAPILVFALLASVTLAITIGPAAISPADVWASVAHHLGLGESSLPPLRDAIVRRFVAATRDEDAIPPG